jgi:hypothetical protein
MLFINKKNLIKLKQSIEVLATTWMNFENIISERNQSQKTTYHMNRNSYVMSRIGISTEAEIRSMVAQVWEGGNGRIIG